MMKVSIHTTISKPLETIWKAYITPKDIDQWNHASLDWETVGSVNDFRVNGFFKYPMRAKDGSFGFDFEGQYLEITPLKYIKYRLLDDRVVETKFSQLPKGVYIEVVFDAESENPIEMQRGGWQDILDAFKNYVVTLN
ncbi:SRPBCC domain-containing protein [Acholeplasma vituli]|uniref:SRPBCC domain-containing protein n=1 Tax=Paracholeplasma vituli TaxID=69473 RepID=A0ABT2PVG3_9MOLU|nr:SRPBCC domain-containing protein [Paracholeplasma vituli]MCU0104934.1 SRPBCC domain-containing protein [Paracholeplasma vituli]